MPTLLVGNAQMLCAKYLKLPKHPHTDIYTLQVAWDDALKAIHEARRSIGPNSTESADIEAFQDLLKEMEIKLGERP